MALDHWVFRISRTVGDYFVSAFGASQNIPEIAPKLNRTAHEVAAERGRSPATRFLHPLSNVRRWRAATAHGNGKCPADLKRDAVAAWRRFVACVQALPADQAMPLWQIALAEASNHGTQRLLPTQRHDEVPMEL